MKPAENDELFWQAFQYAVDDLPVGAAESFERRLADDQQAREALAEAIELSAAVRMVGDEVTPQVEPRRPYAARTAVWTAMVAAACAALWIGRATLFVDRPSEENIAVDASQRNLAVVWAVGQATADWAIPGGAAVSLDDSFVDEIDETSPMGDDPSPPDWLVAALHDARSASGPVDN